MTAATSEERPTVRGREETRGEGDDTVHNDGGDEGGSMGGKSETEAEGMNDGGKDGEAESGEAEDSEMAKTMEKLMRGGEHIVAGCEGTMRETEIWDALKSGKIECSKKSRMVYENGEWGKAKEAIMIFKGSEFSSSMKFVKGERKYQRARHEEVFRMLAAGELTLNESLLEDDSLEVVRVAKVIESQIWNGEEKAAMTERRATETATSSGGRSAMGGKSEERDARRSVGWGDRARVSEAAKGKGGGGGGALTGRQGESGKERAAAAERPSGARLERTMERTFLEKPARPSATRRHDKSPPVKYPMSQTGAVYGRSPGASQALSQRSNPVLLEYMGERAARRPEGLDLLSNPAQVKHYSTMWGESEVRTCEHSFQMTKAVVHNQREAAWEIHEMESGISAKQRGGRYGVIKLRWEQVEKWNEISRSVMRMCQLDKFISNKLAAEVLLDTGERPIFETSRDGTWGVAFDTVRKSSFEATTGSVCRWDGQWEKIGKANA